MLLGLAISLCLFSSAVVHGHEYMNRGRQLGEQRVDWRTGQITRVVGGGSHGSVIGGQVVTLEGKQCLEGLSFYFDVDDRYAFDIDEAVRLEVEFYQHTTDVQAQLAYERNGQSESRETASIPAHRAGPRAYKKTFMLDRARFANRSLFGTDFSLNVHGTGASSAEEPTITICDVKLERNNATIIPDRYGRIAIQVLDDTGKGVPARIGIYDATGRLPLPSEEAIAIKRAEESFRVVNLTPSLIPWPASNPSGFYIDRAYHAKLPVGQYELVVAKGPEYHIQQLKFEIEENKTKSLRVKLRRWDDLPAKGWYSGDNHIHYVRHSKSDDPNLAIFTQAEDVHVANILQMGNIAYAHWPQYDWNPLVVTNNPTYSFVPGQEDPRTFRRGHTISLHLKEPIRDPEHYLLYHKVFEKARAQGGVTGYAHVFGEGLGNARAGLALDVPFGLVDFVEVLQFGKGGSSVWFDFLNLGYKLAPSAGTDYMTDGTLPGAERTYVYVPKPFSLRGWFDALKRGEAFVTNGPMLELSVNGKRMGSELRLKTGEKLIIDATASINPDIDFLESLELIEQGEVVKSVKVNAADQTRLELHHEMSARNGTWLVVRAKGKRPMRSAGAGAWDTNQGAAKIALSGAVYVYVDGQGFSKPSAVPQIVERIKQSLERALVPESEHPEECCELWDTHEPTQRLWDSQKGPLKQRVDEVLPIYDRMVLQAKMAMAGDVGAISECASGATITKE